MSISEMITQNEKVFQGAVNLKYYFVPSVKPSKHLIVVFSGFNGSESQGAPARYNYVDALMNVECNKLFILDQYNDVPCYYIGRDKAPDYEVTVAALIYKIINQENLKNSDVISIGSSKGGTAALYFGIKYNLGHVISGGMQVKVGHYLELCGQYSKDTVLNFIAGGNDSYAVNYLDEVFENVFYKSKFFTKLSIHCGLGDHHYLSHVKPFLEVMESKGIQVNTDLQEYSGHGQLGYYFTEFLQDEIGRICNEVFIKNTTITKIDDCKLSVKCSLPKCFENDQTITFAYYIFKDNLPEPVERMYYSNIKEYTYETKSPGHYHARIYVRKGEKIVYLETQAVCFDREFLYGKMDMVTIDVFGSCVTRDTFEFPRENTYKLGRYFARSSLISAYSKPIPISMNEIQLSSPFQKGLVYDDLSKTFTKHIRQGTPADYIILDFIDERLSVFETEGSFLTYSMEYSNSGIQKEGCFVDKEKRLSTWKEKAVLLIQDLLVAYKPENIILHKAFWHCKYLGQDGLVSELDRDDIEFNNQMLSEYYQFIQDRIPGLKIIQLNDYYADENHKWGLAPFHYESQYYIEFNQKLGNIIESK